MTIKNDRYFLDEKTHDHRFVLVTQKRKMQNCATENERITEVIITRMIYDKNVIDFGSDI